MSALVSEFCQWLLQDRAPQAKSTSIILHGKADEISDALVEEISHHLNEYDDEANGLWLGASRRLVDTVASDPNLTQLMDLGGCCGCQGGCCSRGNQTVEEKQAVILRALASRGNLVFSAPPGPLLLPARHEAFHAGIGRRADVLDRCHITVDPELIEGGCLPQIVADVYLEWNHSRRIDTPPA